MIVGYVAQGASSRLPPDAWATLVAAFVGAAVALIVVALQRKFERRDRIKDENGRKRAIATALLFEIDNHYRSNIRDLLSFFEQHENESSVTVIKPMSTNPFPVYVGNVSALGGLPPTLVEVIVHYYGELRGYVATLNQYTVGFEMWSQNFQAGRGIVHSLIPKIRKEATAITQLTYTACGLLCYFVGIEFTFPRIGVENDPRVQPPARETLIASRTQLATEMGQM